MSAVYHLLCREEEALLACLRDLLRFGQAFDNSLLESAERSLADVCGSSTRMVVSQGLFLARILEEDGYAAGPQAPQPRLRRHGSENDIQLLSLIEAAQSSRSRLERLLRAFVERPSAELVFVMIRFAALLLSAGLRLPQRAPQVRRTMAQTSHHALPRLALQVT